LFELPEGAGVGTSSLRRSCQILERRPDLRVVSLRGNVQTRLRKLEEEDLAGVVLAVAGLRRLGLESRITEVLEPEVSLPAVGQGALAIECREDDAELRRMLEALEHRLTRIAVTAERAFLARLEGGCTVPVAAHARVEGERVRLQALVGRPDGTQVLRGTREGGVQDAARIGAELADALLTAGGKEILSAHAAHGVAYES
jgi:hydroxymethylbilane synthase